MRLLIAALAAALFFVLSSLPAVAQRMPCGDGAAIAAMLEADWGEVPAALALDAAGRLVQILANVETGTWSMLMTAPGGRTCLIHHGTDWSVAVPANDPGEAS